MYELTRVAGYLAMRIPRVDVVQDGHFLKPKAFSGATDCDGIRKTMKFELAASPFVVHKDRVRGFVFDVASGELQEVTAA